MSGIKGKDTKPELFVRKLLHRAGYRFRLYRKDLPGKPDIVLPKWKTVIFVNGCYWHGHEDCYLFRLPKSRTEFWEKKIGTNKVRDSRNCSQLKELGWHVGVIWECALRGKCKLPEGVILNLLEMSVRSENKSWQIRGLLDRGGV